MQADEFVEIAGAVILYDAPGYFVFPTDRETVGTLGFFGIDAQNRVSYSVGISLLDNPFGAPEVPGVRFSVQKGQEYVYDFLTNTVALKSAQMVPIILPEEPELIPAPLPPEAFDYPYSVPTPAAPPKGGLNWGWLALIVLGIIAVSKRR